MRTIGIIQARLDSRRFPRKVLAPLRGRPVLEHVVSRAMSIRGLDRVVVATTDLELAAKVNCSVLVLAKCYALDVLGRFCHAAMLSSAELVMRICGDAPLLDVKAAERLIAEYDGSDYAGYRVNGKPHAQVPQGYFPELIRTDALFRLGAMLHPNDPRREHVTQGAYESGRFSCQWLEPLPEHQHREPAAIDTPEDLQRVAEMEAAWN